MKSEKWLRLLAVIGVLFMSLSRACGGDAQRTKKEKSAEVRCRVCGVHAAASETRYVFTLKDKEDTKQEVCSLVCLVKHRKERDKISTFDYHTKKKIDAHKGYYLYRSKVIPDLSLPPFVTAYGSKDTALSYQRKYGGEVYGFGQVSKKLSSFRGKTEKFPGVTKMRCPMCGMDSSKSQVPYLMVRRNSDNRLGCALGCSVVFRDKSGEDVISVKAMDKTSKRWIDVEKAWYVEGSKLMPQGTMYPFAWPFAVKEGAERFQKKDGGKVLSYEEMLELLPHYKRRKK